MNQPNQEQNEQTNYQVKVEKKHNYFYKITNLIDGKYYYGIHSTDNLNDRYMGKGVVLQLAYKKYGRYNFQKEIIADYSTRKEASDHEKIVVTMDLVLDENCYNIKTGGLNECTIIFTDEHKMKISIAHKGKKLSKEHLEKLIEVNEGKIISEETRIKMSNSQKGRKHSDDTKEKIRLVNIGKTQSEETKKKRKEHYNHTSHPNKGITLSEDWKNKISEANMGNRNAIRNKCIVNGVIYESVTLAAKSNNITRRCMRHRLKSKTKIWENWQYYDEDNI